ncbi:uncharacterized protein LY89DRAFT_685011 [Mollisia scopiformis]|uniref:F-box domain-containing protein n=1 Tax=Mollisia scopiformis TaxID=149040 RepID=A0A194XA42_MOLSC|nr:uncharacterized protein LY89DRAFT_685011 [Mollisia scopiformis]KUJ17036.1 hypothetical protein LY89DRAFT_685011 [Mollisia scopiformis]
MSFPQFTAFPPEMHSLILDSCTPNDLVCLRLTCKYLYDLAPSKKEPISLESTDTGPLCQCKDATKDWQSRWTHRRDCHKLSYEAAHKRNQALGRSTPEMKAKCRTSYGSDHCECFTRRSRLHFRLKSWMPSGMNYCGHCERFTVRKRGHNGRCYHGSPKPRKFEGHYWTHTSRGGAFGRKIWKKWFNNRAMNRLETRLQKQILVDERKGSDRYSLRQLEAKTVDTRVDRDNKSSTRYGYPY